MWKYLNGVSTESNEKKEEKTPETGRNSRETSREYEKTRTRKLNSKWQVGLLRIFGRGATQFSKPVAL